MYHKRRDEISLRFLARGGRGEAGGEEQFTACVEVDRRIVRRVIIYASSFLRLPAHVRFNERIKRDNEFRRTNRNLPRSHRNI